MKLLILGDSHVGIYTNKYIFNNIFEKISIHQCDSEDYYRSGKFTPYLLNTIAQRGSEIIGHYIKRYFNYDYIMLIFGEPDIRIHFHKQINILGRDEDEVINTLIQTLLNTLKTIIPTKMKIVIRYILPTREYSMYGINNNSYVPKGTLKERVRYTNKLNNKLKIECEKNNIFFFENICINELTNEQGELLNEYCDGHTHYNNNALPILQKEIKYNFNKFLNTI